MTNTITKEMAIKMFVTFLKEKKIFGQYMLELYKTKEYSKVWSFLQQNEINILDLKSIFSFSFWWAKTKHGIKFWKKIDSEWSITCDNVLKQY